MIHKETYIDRCLALAAWNDLDFLLVLLVLALLVLCQTACLIFKKTLNSNLNWVGIFTLGPDTDGLFVPFVPARSRPPWYVTSYLSLFLQQCVLMFDIFIL